MDISHTGKRIQQILRSGVLFIIIENALRVKRRSGFVIVTADFLIVSVNRGLNGNVKPPWDVKQTESDDAFWCLIRLRGFSSDLSRKWGQL